MKILRLIAFIIVIVIAVLGIVFIFLDIFDIGEDYRIHLPVDIINLVLFWLVAVPVSFISARNYIITGSKSMLWLSCGVLLYGVGSLLREWLADIELNTPLTIYYCTALLASVLHFIGACYSIGRQPMPSQKAGIKTRILLLCYLGVAGVVSIVTLLTFQNIIPPFYIPGESSTLLKEIIRGVAIVFFLASSVIYLRLYYKSRTDFAYFYSLGLVLFVFCLISTSLGVADTRISWLGRVSQYIGSIYFLMSVLPAYRQAGVTDRDD